MALPIAATPVTPHAVLTASYRVIRQGVYPIVVLHYTEVLRDLEESVEVTNVSGADITVPGWYGRTDLVGKEVWDDTTSIGTVLAFSTDVATLSAAPAIAPTSVSVQKLTATGSLAWKEMPHAKAWEVVLNMAAPAVAGYLGNLLGSALFQAVKATLAEIPTASVADADILAAVSALAGQGVNIDTFIAQQAEVVESDRRLNTLPTGTQVVGQAP